MKTMLESGRFELHEDDRLEKLVRYEKSSFQKVAMNLGISRQAIRQTVQKPIGCIWVMTLLKVVRVLGYHLELVKDNEVD